MQYNSPSTESPSYSCGIHKIQRYNIVYMITLKYIVSEFYILEKISFFFICHDGPHSLHF